jgi:hypothetical protein
MFELLSATQANSVLPVELSHCFTVATNVVMHDFQELTFDLTPSLGFNEMPPKPPKSFTFDATANLGSDQVAPRPR